MDYLKAHLEERAKFHINEESKSVRKPFRIDLISKLTTGHLPRLIYHEGVLRCSPESLFQSDSSLIF